MGLKLIDADALTKQIEDFHCKDCDNYNFVRCRACRIDDMIAYLDEAPTVGGWISTADRLPEKTGYVLAACKSGLVTELLFSKYHGLFNVMDSNDDISTAIPVSHWMPLPKHPEPPAEEEDE